MNNFKLFSCLFVSAFILNSCSSDSGKEDCKKVKSSSGKNENGVMVYRITFTNGETIVVNKATAEYYTNSNATKECYEPK